jgi:hypothetical protein
MGETRYTPQQPVCLILSHQLEHRPSVLGSKRMLQDAGVLPYSLDELSVGASFSKRRREGQAKTSRKADAMQELLLSKVYCAPFADCKAATTVPSRSLRTLSVQVSWVHLDNCSESTDPWWPKNNLQRLGCETTLKLRSFS